MFLIFSVPGGSSICFVLVIGTPERAVEMYWVVGRQCYRSAQLYGLSCTSYECVQLHLHCSIHFSEQYLQISLASP